MDILRILATCEANTGKISNFCIFWSRTLLIHVNDGLLAELQGRMSRSCRFLPHA